MAGTFTPPGDSSPTSSIDGGQWTDLGPCDCCGPAYYYYPYSSGRRTVTIPCCPNPVPVDLLAEFITDCGNFNVNLTYTESIGDNIFIWQGSGNCQLCEEDGCAEAADPCWTLIAEADLETETCGFTLYNCDLIITFGANDAECDPLLIVLQNFNPFPCVCAAGGTVIVTAA